MKRQEIMYLVSDLACSENIAESIKELENELQLFIDDIEDRVNQAKDDLDVESLGDLHKIENAKEKLDKLSSDLY